MPPYTIDSFTVYFAYYLRTLTVAANKFTTANILTGLLGQAAANGSVVNITVAGN